MNMVTAAGQETERLFENLLLLSMTFKMQKTM